MAADELKDLRDQIDKIDAELLQLIARRATLAQRVAQIKLAAQENPTFYRPDREAQILQRIGEMNPGPLSDPDAVHIMREIISACLALEQQLKVAYLGPQGTYTQMAAEKHFGSFVACQPATTVGQVFRDVETERCDYGVVPIENSVEGIVTHTVDSFPTSKLQICGEVELVINHCLLTNATKLDEITRILAHQQALAQCRDWLAEHLPGVEQQAVASNAEAARQAAKSSAIAAIASYRAAALYGLRVYEKNIEDDTDNTTRFLILGKQCPAPSGMDRTSLMFTTPNEPGALSKALSAFDRHGINMTRIESRPAHTGKWLYSFFIDIDGHAQVEPVPSALRDLAGAVDSYRVLGSYPRSVL